MPHKNNCQKDHLSPSNNTFYALEKKQTAKTADIQTIFFQQKTNFKINNLLVLNLHFKINEYVCEYQTILLQRSIGLRNRKHIYNN